MTHDKLFADYSKDINILGVIAACPMYSELCSATIANASTDLTAAQLDATKRLLTLKKNKDTAKLSFKALTTSAMTTKTFSKESCTFVVKSECGAPVVSVDATSTSVGHWKVMITEYTGEGLKGPLGTGNVILSGTSFYPAEAKPSKFAIATTNTPNNELGDIRFREPISTGNHFRNMPGRVIIAWIKSIVDEYKNFNTNKAKYDDSRKKNIQTNTIVQPNSMPRYL